MRTVTLASRAQAATMPRTAGWLCVLVLSLVPAQAQPSTGYFIETVAGAPRLLGDNGPATSALLWSPQGVSVDACRQSLYRRCWECAHSQGDPGRHHHHRGGNRHRVFGDNGPALVGGTLFPLEGRCCAERRPLYCRQCQRASPTRQRKRSYHHRRRHRPPRSLRDEGDFPTNAQFNYPRDIAIDQYGNILVLDTNNARLRRFTPGGRMTTVAGSGVLGFYGDQGPATQAQLSLPWGFALDRAGNIYIADTGNNPHPKDHIPTAPLRPSRAWSRPGFTGDGAAAAFASLNRPRRWRLDAAGNIYIADTGNQPHSQDRHAGHHHHRSPGRRCRIFGRQRTRAVGAAQHA